MPYVVDSKFVYAGVTTSATIDLPLHAAGDLLIAVAQQDVGTGTFSCTSASGSWTNAFSTGQEASSGQRTYAWYRLAASGNEAPVEVSSTLSEDLVVTVVVVRGVDQTTPINASGIVSRSGSMNMQLPSLTTTNPKCLVVCGVATDGSSSNHYADFRNITKLHSSNYGAGALSIGWLNHRTAGPIPTTGFANYGGASGPVFAIAVNDDGTDRKRGGVVQFGDIIRRNGYFGAGRGDVAVTWEAPAAVFSSIGGIPCQNMVNIPVPAFTQQRINFNGDVSAEPLGNWMGAFMVLSSVVDMTGAIFASKIYFYNIRPEYFTTECNAICFVDVNGNFRQFRLLTSYAGYRVGHEQQVLIDLENFSPRYQSGAMDWSRVKRIGFLFNKIGGDAPESGSFGISEMVLLRTGNVVLDGPANQSDFSIGADLNLLIDGWNTFDIASSQGLGQGLLKAPLQFGAQGSGATIDFSNVSLECQPPYNVTASRCYTLINEDPTAWSIKAATGDSISLSGSLLIANTKRQFLIDPATSPNADINFSRCILKGFAITNNVNGVVINGASIAECFTTTLNGGGLSGCFIFQSKESPAVRTSDPSKIEGCLFMQGAVGGHAIEITQPGTYTFTGNTFSGYGVDGSTDAAIYNNSGGAVTLNIAGGGSTPTVRNGASATTTINNNVLITLENVVVGSSIRVEKVSDGSLVEFRVADATTEAFSLASSVVYRIKVRKASGSPLYKPWETTVTPTGDVPITVNQLPD